MEGRQPSPVASDVPGTLVFDSHGKSFVYNFERSVSTSRIELYPESKTHRVTKHDISLFVKNEQGDEWTEITKDKWMFSMDSNNGSIHIDFINAYEMRYLKIHNNWDDRDFLNKSHDRYATFKGSLDSMIRVWTYESGLDEEYGYDSNSNRISLNGVDYKYYKNKEGLNTARVMYDGEWYYEYDLRGNRIRKGKSATESGNTVTVKTDDEYWVYTWDLHNRLVRAKQFNAPDKAGCIDVSYVYDPNNYRIRRTSVLQKSVTDYAYDSNGSVTYQKETAGETVTEKSYVYFDGKIVGFYINNEKYYTVTDTLGSIIDVYAEDGTEVWAMDYTSFGMKGGETVEKIQIDAMFTGKDMDPETGLTYHWNRWRGENGYNWISEDSARDGTNWYGYCGNNPLVFIDPDGRMDTAAIRDVAQQCGPYAGYAFLGMMALGLLCSPEVRQEVGQAIYDVGVAVKDSVVTTYNNTEAKVQTYQAAKTKTKELTKEQTDKKSTGSYTITFESGKTYSGKGPLKRAMQSSVRESVMHDTLPINIDWTPASDKKEAFLDEYMRIQDNGGPASQYADASEYNYNIIQSPGEKIYKAEHNGLGYPRSIPQNGGE